MQGSLVLDGFQENQVKVAAEIGGNCQKSPRVVVIFAESRMVEA